MLSPDHILAGEVDRYNEYMDQKMEYMEIDPDFYVLLIDGVEITEGDIVDITERVKAINRENGLNWL
jgi:hypothetical protein